MWVFFRAVLLVLLVLGSDAAPGCGLPATVKTPDLHKMVDSHWVLVDGFTDYDDGFVLLSSANSSVVEIQLNADGETFLFVERNIVMGKCLTFYVNMTVPDPATSDYTLHLAGPGVKDFDGNVTAYDDQGKAKIFQTCPHCVTMIYRGVFDGTVGNMLLIYRQEGKHLDAEELAAARVQHQKTAECLKFRVPATFRYDGTSEFCREKKREEGAEA